MTASDATSAAAHQPPGGVRALISYLIFLHFFVLLVGIKSSASSSGLEQDLRNKVPGLKPYLQFLGMDLSYMFHLTYYDGENVEDTDHFVEADIKLPDGSTKLIVFGPSGFTPGVRSRRYERLAFRAARFGESQNENIASLLPQVLARRIMLETGSREITLRFRRRLLQNLMLDPATPEGQAAHSRTPDDPFYFQTAYEARALMNDQGEVIVAQIKAASDQAAPAGSPPPATPRPTGTAPAATGTAAPPTSAAPRGTGGIFSGPALSFPSPLATPTATPTATGGAKP